MVELWTGVERAGEPLILSICTHIHVLGSEREAFNAYLLNGRGLYMRMANGELAVMCATISYCTYSGIHRCDLAHATNNRVGGSGIWTRPPYLRRKADSYERTRLTIGEGAVAYKLGLLI